MDPRLLDRHLQDALDKIRLIMGEAETYTGDIQPLLDLVKHIQAARRELWQDKPELEGAKELVRQVVDLFRDKPALEGAKP